MKNLSTYGVRGYSAATTRPVTRRNIKKMKLKKVCGKDEQLDLLLLLNKKREAELQQR